MVGWRICGVPSEREGEVIGSQSFTLGWYAVTRWGTQNGSSIGKVFSDPLGYSERHRLEYQLHRAITVPSLEQF